MDGTQGDVLFERRGQIGHITLNRPAALNALTLEMSLEMDRVLDDWSGDDGIAAVVVVGAPRDNGKVPFCAGGDIQAIFDGRDDPEKTFARNFFRHEYRLDRRIFHYPKPYIAIVDGVVMGGGVGVSINGSHRIMTENAIFAMPETGIGLFPDVGGTYFLPRCPGSIGMYLALTGTRLKWADACYVGVATDAVPSSRLADLEAAFIAADLSDDVHTRAAAVIGSFATDPGPPPLADLQARIDRLFTQSSMEWIIKALEAEPDEWATGQLARLAAKSPTSLKVVFRQIMCGRALDFDEAMRLEYRLARRFSESHDFYEGIRAVVVDKDNAPQWQPASLDRVSESDVEAYFSALEDGELNFD